jgi:hypothetical protein
VPEEIITTITQPKADGALEIALIHSEAASPRVELRELVWGAGLGWYRQHTCKLDSRTAHALLQTLGRLCTRLEAGERERESRKVIPFPRSVPVSKGIESHDHSVLRQ